MFSVLIRGVLTDNPVVRSGKSGDYTTAKIVTREGPERGWSPGIAARAFRLMANCLSKWVVNSPRWSSNSWAAVVAISVP